MFGVASHVRPSIGYVIIRFCLWNFFHHAKTASVWLFGRRPTSSLSFTRKRTDLTSPLLSGYTLITFFNCPTAFEFVSSVTYTMSPTATFRLSVCHLFRLAMVGTAALLGMVTPGAGFCGVTPFRSKNR